MTIPDLPPPPPEKLEQLRAFARANKGMSWDVKVDKLDDVAIVERIFCYGDWHDYKNIELWIGKNRVRRIFEARGHMPRSNLRAETVSFFDYYYANTPA